MVSLSCTLCHVRIIRQRITYIIMCITGHNVRGAYMLLCTYMGGGVKCTMCKIHDHAPHANDVDLLGNTLQTLKRIRKTYTLTADDVRKTGTIIAHHPELCDVISPYVIRTENEHVT